MTQPSAGCFRDRLGPAPRGRRLGVTIGKHKDSPGRASRAAALYSRHHKTPAYVLKHADGSHTWTAPFNITSGAIPLPPGSQIVAKFLDGERRD